MARRTRIEFEGALYHVLDRGDRRESIFHDDVDRERFLRTLGEACARTGWRVHAWVLMSNHYHLMLETPEANLVAGMQWFQTAVTVRYNRRHHLCGHLFQGRYKSVVVDPGERSYSVTLSDYIHLNPVRARMVGLDDRLVDYRWSSYPLYVRGAGRLSWFETERVLGELGMEDNVEGRRGYARRMRERAAEELVLEKSPDLAELRRGWCLGTESFRERMLRLVDTGAEKLRGSVSREAPVVREHGEEEARRLISAGLEYFALKPEDLQTLMKGDKRKLALAVLVRKRTTVSNHWLAAALNLGHASRVSHALHRADDLKIAKKLENALL